ncbi:hypothetical protein GPY61_14110 [Massilia sp. NEAU-DD11]|uniref:Uncharacterized protein n=1 Tax=Massilia cellulosiltytica TaxID=2683234 RepID=A0A7X3FZT7_9BURK|nr:hypothetical protein [Telluria cellulosilytica]MVW61065.1 hypothetical protein [Telluria cellulosilytica]
MEQLSTPIYTDMKFWSLVISILALVSSQWKFFTNLFRRARVSVEPYSRMYLTHNFGAPSVDLHVIVSNTGGRNVRVRGISLNITSSSGDSFSVRALGYFQKPDDTQPILLTPFTLLPGDEWSHVIRCLLPNQRQDDKIIREATSSLRAYINDKIAQRKEDEPKDWIHAEPSLVQPFLRYFERDFRWHPDEYTMSVSIETDPPKAFVDRQYRFVLFESDTQDLKVIVNKYDIGEGVYFTQPDTVRGVFVSLQKGNE